MAPYSTRVSDASLVIQEMLALVVVMLLLEIPEMEGGVVSAEAVVVKELSPDVPRLPAASLLSTR